MSLMTKVIVYTKEGCHLCERVIAQLEKMNSTHTLEISIQDITSDSNLFERYKEIIPVVSVDGEVKFTAESLTRGMNLENSLRSALM